jgi:hypothetical protein
MPEEKPELREILARLERLEKENRILRGLKWLTAASCSLLCLFLVERFGQRVGAAAEGSGQVLEAQELRIKDSSGRLRADVRSTDDAVAFVLYSADGQRRVAISANSAAGLTLSDTSGKARVGIALTKDGPSLGLHDASGNPRAFLALTRDGPSLTLYDGNGSTRTSLSLNKDGPGLSLHDSKGNRRASLGLTQSGSGLVFLGHDGEARASFGFAQDNALLALFDSRGQVLSKLP